jgi:hypothetical protein
VHEITFKLTFDEYADGLLNVPVRRPPRAARRPRAGGRPWILLFAIIVVLIFLVPDLFNALHKSAHAFLAWVDLAFPYLVGVILGMVLLLFLLIAFRRRLLRSTLRREFESGWLVRFLIEQTIRIDSHGFTQTTANGVATNYWSGVEDIVARKDFIYFFLTPKLAYLIPKRAFATPVDCEAFVGAAKAFRQSALDGIPTVIPAGLDTRIRAKDQVD